MIIWLLWWKGIVRVSAIEQYTTLQIDELKKVGCEKIFRDKVCGAKIELPGLQEALDFLREGDSLVVWRLDSLGRSLKHLLKTVSMLEELIDSKKILRAFQSHHRGDFNEKYAIYISV
jgi:DNA invertase Pin-like site-specific DNA recombinase